MQFGGLISTSNSYAEGAKEVTIQTDQPLVWTMGIRPITLLKSGVQNTRPSANGTLSNGKDRSGSSSNASSSSS